VGSLIAVERSGRFAGLKDSPRLDLGLAVFEG
jgi:hypothetical protein